MADKTPVKFSELDALRLIYYEILAGYSYDDETGLFIKHLTDFDHFAILRKREDLFHFYVNNGAPHESQLLKTALEIESWSQEKEDRIAELKVNISDTERNMVNVLTEQRPAIETVLTKLRDELSETLFERRQVLGMSIDDLIDDDIVDFIVYLSLFQDEALTVKVCKTYEEFQGMDEDKLAMFNMRLNWNGRKFSDDKLKAVATLPIFLNKLSLCKDDIMSFFNMPLARLTGNQNLILSLGSRNLNTLSQAKGFPPDLNAGATIQELVQWYDIQASLIVTRQNAQTPQE